MRIMQRLTDYAVEALGGTTQISILVKTPVSTVHSWRTNGITQSRLHHLQLAAKDAGKKVNWKKALEEVPTSRAQVAA